MTFSKKRTLRRKLPNLSRLGILAVVFVLTSAFIVLMITQMNNEDSISLNEILSEPYVESSVEKLYVIRKEATECLTKFSESLTDEKSSLLNKAMDNGTESSTLSSNVSSVFSVLSKFKNLISSLDVKSAIIEPSILYCMITDYYQDILVKRNFNMTNISRSKNIVTFGIFEHDVAILHKEKNIHKFREAGFLTEFVVTPVADWMKVNGVLSDTYLNHVFNITSKIDSFVSHIFYKSKLITIHVVVFYERGNYLWHAALDSNNGPNIPSNEELQFSDYNGAYEKFTFFTLDDLLFGKFSIPSTAHYFLFETMSSCFLECKSLIAENAYLYSDQPESHPQMSVERFKERTHIVLHQLKHIFHPLLMNLWIWSGTMLGWYRQCDIIPYTTDVDFGAWASEVEDYNRIVNLLLNNEHAKIRERMGMLEEALEFNINCHGLRTDVFFLYQINNGSWCSGHSPKGGYYFRYYYPNFTLCSADLLGEKVQVPCETEKVILSEYGPEWNKPVSKWNYQSSIKNRGPNRYWDKSRLKYAYATY